jgi:hypothetical protein
MLETIHGDILSGFSEAVRDLVKEARLVFALDGVELCGKDSANVLLVQYKLPSSLIAGAEGAYRCSDRIEVGIDTKIVAKCMSSASYGDSVSLSVDLEKDADHLTIRCHNSASGKRSVWTIITPVIPEDPIMLNSIESCGFNGEIKMSTLLFHEMMRDLTKSDAVSVRVCCDGNRLALVACGRNIRASFEVERGDSPSHFSYEPNPKDRWPVCECYAMMFLQKIAKAKISSSISIHLQPDFPIAFAFTTEIGKLSYIVSPREDEEWTENPSAKMVMPPGELAVSDQRHGSVLSKNKKRKAQRGAGAPIKRSKKLAPAAAPATIGMPITAREDCSAEEKGEEGEDEEEYGGTDTNEEDEDAGGGGGDCD